LLGARVIGRTTPYLLPGEVRADFVEVERLLPQGKDPAAIVLRYRGALLPPSKAPVVVEARVTFLA
jgi:hypothetical protein